MKRYNLEIDCYGDDAPFEYRWLCFETLVTDGDDFEECLANASLSTVDQDGGSGPEMMVIDLSVPAAARYARKIRDAMVEQDDKRGRDA